MFDLSFTVLLCVWRLAWCEELTEVFTTPEDSLPVRAGQVEILNSSLSAHAQWTLCARFQTYRFSTHSDISYQYVLSVGDIPLLASYVGQECEYRYPGCTQYYREKYQAAWRLGVVRGYFRYTYTAHKIIPFLKFINDVNNQ